MGFTLPVVGTTAGIVSVNALVRVLGAYVHQTVNRAISARVVAGACVF